MEITGNVNATVNAEVDAKICVTCDSEAYGDWDQCNECHNIFPREPESDEAAERPIVKCPKHGEELPCGACHFTQPQTRRIKKTPKMNEHLDYDLEMIRFCLRQLDEKRTEIGHLELELDELLDKFERHAIEERE